MRHDQLDIADLQEIAFTQKDAKAFRSFAFKQGFRFYYQLFYSAGGRAGRGVGILVNKRLRSSLLRTWAEPDCQSVAVNINGLNIFSTYWAVSGFAPQTAQQLVVFMSQHLSRRPWAIFG